MKLSILRYAILALATGGLLPSGASACLLELKYCVSSDGTMIEQYFHLDNVIVFEARDSEKGEISVVLCPSKASLVVRNGNDSYPPTSTVTDVLIPAIEGEAEFTIRDIARDLRAKGLHVNRRQLADGHCVCDLPKYPDPPGCPDYGQDMNIDKEQAIELAGAIQ